MLFVVRVKSVGLSVVVAGALFSASLCCNFSISTKFKLSGTLFYDKSFRLCCQCRAGSIFSFNHVKDVNILKSLYTYVSSAPVCFGQLHQ